MDGETKASEVQELASRSNELSDSVDWWSTLIVVPLIVAALAAIVVAVTTRMGFVRSKQLTAVQTKLISGEGCPARLRFEGKRRQKIADSNKLAAAAEQRAAVANLVLEKFKPLERLHLSSSNE